MLPGKSTCLAKSIEYRISTLDGVDKRRNKSPTSRAHLARSAAETKTKRSEREKERTGGRERWREREKKNKEKETGERVEKRRREKIRGRRAARRFRFFKIVFRVPLFFSLSRLVCSGRCGVKVTRASNRKTGGRERTRETRRER